MAFKVFEEYGAAARDEATLRISGYLFVSKGLQKRVDAEEANGAVLLYDEEGKRIGIRFHAIYDENNVAMRNVSKEKSGVAVNILPLLRFYGIKKPSEKRTLQVSKEQDMLIVDIAPLCDDNEGKDDADDLLN